MQRRLVIQKTKVSAFSNAQSRIQLVFCCSLGFLVTWFSCFLVFLFLSFRVGWFSCSLVFLFLGFLVLWFSCSQVFLFLGFLPQAESDLAFCVLCMGKILICIFYVTYFYYVLRYVFLVLWFSCSQVFLFLGFLPQAESDLAFCVLCMGKILICIFYVTYFYYVLRYVLLIS